MKNLPLLILAVALTVPAIGAAKDRQLFLIDAPLTPTPSAGALIGRVRAAERAMFEAANAMSKSDARGDLMDARGEVKRLLDVLDGKKMLENDDGTFAAISGGNVVLLNRSDAYDIVTQADQVISNMPPGAPAKIADRLERAHQELTTLAEAFRPADEHRRHGHDRDRDQAGAYPPPAGTYPPPPAQADPFEDLLRNMARERLGNRLGMVQQSIARRPLTAAQAERVLELFRPADAPRLRALGLMGPTITDRQNAMRLLNFFAAPNDRALAQRMINGETVPVSILPMAPQTVAAIAAELNAPADFRRRMQILETRSREGWLTIEQVRQLLPAFSNQYMDAIRLVAPRVVDPENRGELNRGLYTPIPANDLDQIFGV